MITKYIRKARLIARRLYDSSQCRRHSEKLEIGSPCSWHVLSTSLRSGTTVISGGVGNDMSFELTLAKQYGCRVELYDPSPTGIATAQKKENQHPLINFHPVGLSNTCGRIQFSPPHNPNEGSYRVNVGNSSLVFECISIPKILEMEKKGAKIILKIDIEGFEYDILESLNHDEIARFEQICLEFHHFMPGFSRKQTNRIIKKIKSAGFSLMHKNRCDYLFVNDKLLA